MDNALLTNLLLFLGAMGISFALDGGSRDEDDRPEESSDAGRLSDDHAEADLTADRDTLAWFLHGDEAVAPLSLEARSSAEAGTTATDSAETGSADTGFAAEDSTTAPDAADSAVPEAASEAGAADSGPAEAAAGDGAPATGDAFADDPQAAGHPAGDDAPGPFADDLHATADDLLAAVHPAADPFAADMQADADAHPAGDDETSTAAAVPEGGLAAIAGFASGDRLELEYSPATGADGQPVAPALDVAHSEDGAQATLSLDGQAVAVVSGPGVADLKPGDVALIAV